MAVSAAVLPNRGADPTKINAEVGPNPTLILVANAKMGEMILFTPASEAQRHRVDSWVETPTSVGKSRLERIRHQYQHLNHEPQTAWNTLSSNEL
jgi:hypothetical protein